MKPWSIIHHEMFRVQGLYQSSIWLSARITGSHILFQRSSNEAVKLLGASHGGRGVLKKKSPTQQFEANVLYSSFQPSQFLNLHPSELILRCTNIIRVPRYDPSLLVE